MDKVNFLPEDYLEKKSQQRTNGVCLVLFLLVIAGVGCGFLISRARQSQIDKQMDNIHTRMFEAGESLKQFEELQSKRSSMMSKALICASLMEPVPRSLLLATITNDLVSGTSLLSYKLVSKEVKPIAVAKKRNKIGKKTRKKKDVETEVTVMPKAPQMETLIDISGLALTDLEVAQLISNLDESSLFDEVNLQMSQEWDSDDMIVRHYKLAISIDPNTRANEEDVELARTMQVKGM